MTPPGTHRGADPAGPERLLEARGASVSFGGVHALADVDFFVEKGEIVGVIGPNGAGKTTFLNVLTGFVQPTRGELWFQGENVTGIKPFKLARRGIARTFQNVRLFNRMTVLENVELATMQLGGSRADVQARARRYLDLLGLTRQADLVAQTLDYGSERRLALARAAAAEPKALLLDEPAAGLNADETVGLVDAVRAIQSQVGCSIIVVEHDMALIMGLCDRLHVLDRGKTLAAGTPSEVQRNPLVIEAYLGTEHDAAA